MNSAHSGINTSNLDSRKAYISFNQFKMTKEFNSVKVLALNFVFHNFSAPIVVWRPLKIFAGEGGAWSPGPPCQHATVTCTLKALICYFANLLYPGQAACLMQNMGKFHSTMLELIDMQGPRSIVLRVFKESCLKQCKSGAVLTKFYQEL